MIGKAMEIPINRTDRHVLVFGNRTAGASSGKAPIDELAKELRARKYQIEIVSDPGVLERLSQLSCGSQDECSRSVLIRNADSGDNGETEGKSFA